MDKNATQAPDRATASDAAAASVARPVRSAKDAINAMYAENSNTRLSDYLATSAKDIINSKGDSKSAANLHSHSSATKSRLKARPSASGMLRTAKVEKTPVVHDLSHAMDPLAQRTAPIETKRVVESSAAPQAAPTVIKTSLKLSPKKAAARPQAMQGRSRGTSLSINGQKGQTSLSKMWAARRAEARAKAANTDSSAQVSHKPARPVALDPDTSDTLQAMQQAVQQTKKSAAARPKTRRRAPGLMQDVIRAPRNVDGFSRPNPHLEFASSPEQPATRPADSVKRRFRTAPKGYTAAPEVQESTYESFSDDISARNKPPVEIYGMMEEDYTVKSEGLGVVEDYHPTGDRVSSGLSEQKVAQGSGTAAPDNNKYALGGQSPFFLKSVSVEKRPLSEAPRQSGSKPQAKSQTPSDGTLYEHPDAKPIGGKNVYEKKETKKSLPTKPTVIIPAARKSKAPFIMLIILTIILGAAVGAFAYLTFFQYME